MVYNWRVNSVNVTLLKGTNESPVFNYVNVELTGGELDLTAKSTYIGDNDIEHADVARVLVGTNGNVLSYNPIMIRNYEGPYLFYEKFELIGPTYVSGFTPSVSTIALNISTGTFNVVIFNANCVNNISMAGGYFWVKNDGTYSHGTDLTDIDEYSDGTAFGNKYMNLIWGVTPTNLTHCNLVAVPQGYPGTGNEYITASKAVVDKEQITNFFPADTELTKTFTPIAHTIINGQTDQFEPFGTNLPFFRFLGGKVTSGGGAPAAPTTNYDVLDNIPWTNSGTNVYLTDLTDNVGIGIADPSSGLHIVDKNINISNNAIQIYTLGGVLYVRG